MTSCLTPRDFAQALGLGEESLPPECLAAIAEYGFRYEEVSPEQGRRLVLEILKKLEGGEFSAVGEHRRDVWEKGWSQNLKDLKENNFDSEALLPKYYQTNHHLRWNGRWIAPLDSRFEVDAYTVLRLWLFRKFLVELDPIYEIGCGTGLNLVLLARMFPEKKLYGLDWSRASLQIIEGLARRHSFSLEGHPFDFFHPDYDFPLEKNSAVITLTALEQTGSNHGPFLEYILKQKPALVLSVEPLVELYDETNLLDSLAIRYHRSRGYLENYLTVLRKLEKEERIKILSVHRPRFGGLFNESYSWVVWKPQ